VKTLSSRAPYGIEELAPAWGNLAAAATQEAFFREWLQMQCESLAGTLNAVAVLGPPDTGPFAPVAFWPHDQGGAPRLAEVAESALAERRAVIVALAPAGVPQQAAPATHGLAFPVEVDGHLHGVVAVELVGRPDGELQSALQRLQWGSAWVEAWVRRRQQQEDEDTRARLVAVLDVVASVMEEVRFDDACRSMVTELALRLDCDRVSFGMVRRGNAEVLALSHSAQFGKRMNLIHAVGAAMDEAIDQKAVVRYPALEEDEIVVTRDHAALATEHGSGSILTVPLAGGTTLAGALTFERPAAKPFADTDVELCQSVGAVIARILEIKHLNERSLAAMTRDALLDQARRLLGPRHVKRKLVLVLVVFAAVFFTFATADYRVTAPATIEGAVRRSLAAPFDGYVATADARAGDVAKAGAVLATLDDQDLRLERMKWASQYAQYVKQHQEAVANRDRAKAQIAEALFEQARAQATLLDEQISRAAIKAPFSGIVVKGDLSQSLGAGVKRGEVLFELTPLESYRVIVEVDEGEIADVAPGRKGTLILGSIAGETFPFTVRNITPVTTARDGRYFFLVEGILDQPAERLRPGMEGVGKIDVEPRKVIWIWTHRLLNWARLFIWTYLP
jgi:hypothetical protein